MRPAHALALGALALTLAVAAGCAAVDSVTRGVTRTAADAGVITKDTAKSVGKVSEAFRRSAEEFTDSEEHYIGRSVAANVFATYKALDDEALNAYVTRVGMAVALASDRPETFGGYHFQVLDSDEVNAFAAPGGFIFVTRATLALCEDEDTLAAVLAHEVGHVTLRHGLKSISSARLTEAFATLTGETAQVLTQHQAEELSKTLHGTVSDITGTLFKTGYGKAAEKDADRLAVTFATRAGYDPSGLARVLDAMRRREGVAKGGTFETHPSAEYRLELVNERIEDEHLKAATSPATRLPRFKAAMRA